MKCNVLVFSVLLLFLTKYAKAYLQEDTMDTWKSSITLKSPSSGYSSSGILKSHDSFSTYKTNRNKSLTVIAPSGYSIMVAFRYIDLRPNNQDSLTLSSTTGYLPVPITYSNSRNYRSKKYFYSEDETYYVPGGNLNVTFQTGPYFSSFGYDGFELVYTVQGSGWTQCSKGNFYCGNGRCISSVLTCDGHNHCGDGSSERNCFIVTTGPGRTIGIVSGSFFILIAVICGIYYVFRRRRFALESQTVITSHPPPQTNLPSYPPAYPYPSSQYPPPPPAYSTGITNPTYH